MLIEKKVKLPLEILMETCKMFTPDEMKVVGVETFFSTAYNDNDSINVWEGVLFAVYGSTGSYLVELGVSTLMTESGKNKDEYKLAVYRVLNDYNEPITLSMFTIQDYQNFVSSGYGYIHTLCEKSVDSSDGLQYN